MEDRDSDIEFEYTLVIYNYHFLENVLYLDDAHFGMLALDHFQTHKNTIADLLQLNSTNIVSLKCCEPSGLRNTLCRSLKTMLFTLIYFSVGMKTTNVQIF